MADQPTSVRPPRIQFPALTQEQRDAVISWVQDRLRPLEDVLAELETPERLAYLDSIGAVRLDETVKTEASNAVLQVGGGNGGVSWKQVSANIDVDVFFVITNTALTAQQASQLRAVLNRRISQEILDQRDVCTIDGVAYAQGPVKRHLDIGKVGILHNGVVWAVPNLCRHCGELFYDGQFTVVNGVITHETHAAG